LIGGRVSCYKHQMRVACQPCAALAPYVKELWYCDGHQGLHGTQRLLPRGRFQLAVSLAEGPISALTGHKTTPWLFAKLPVDRPR
jgi:hypothetical protein